MNRAGCLVLLTVCISCLANWQQTEAQSNYNYDLNYYDDYQLYSAGYSYDSYDDSEDGMYFNPYTGYYDDVYGDYFFEDPEESEQDCRIGADGQVKFNGTTPCDLKLEGADKEMTTGNGGLDGVYKVHSCENGRPLYKRDGSPSNEDRVLFYSTQYRDWDITNGTFPQEDDILMFGGSGGREARPQYVDEWSVATEFLKREQGPEEYSRVEIMLTCADGSQIDRPVVQKFGKTPLLTHDEMEEQYSQVYKKARARKGDSSPDVNLGLVTLFVMIGLGIVFGLPYLVARNKRARKAGGRRSIGLSTLLETNRKRGHSN
ncbi:hypothetical protein WJX72_011552 [[Myrmecia] bisecta]|uniref:Uncharacterized protein n=1 Tax=[Myrmecia] bisecta TaxID=41462 RepID=A0AAW1QST2_9CHLO